VNGSPRAEPRPLTSRSFSRAVRHLCEKDRGLRGIVERLGPPPLWTRDTGFPALVQIILEQQVSLASARSAFEKLEAMASPLTPRRFLRLGDRQLKRAGFSRQKMLYCRELARSIRTRRLDLDRFDAMTDEEVHARLTRVKGIGPWTADIYLLMALRRPDTWPAGDLALARAFQKIRGLRRSPTPAQLDAWSHAWRPWRAVAARLLWHDYLNPQVVEPA